MCSDAPNFSTDSPRLSDKSSNTGALSNAGISDATRERPSAFVFERKPRNEASLEQKIGNSDFPLPDARPVQTPILDTDPARVARHAITATTEQPRHKKMLHHRSD
jgi:hypothetical protein